MMSTKINSKSESVFSVSSGTVCTKLYVHCVNDNKMMRQGPY